MINVLNNVINNVKQTPARGSWGSLGECAPQMQMTRSYFIKYLSGSKYARFFCKLLFSFSQNKVCFTRLGAATETEFGVTWSCVL